MINLDARDGYANLTFAQPSEVKSEWRHVGLTQPEIDHHNELTQFL